MTRAWLVLVASLAASACSSEAPRWSSPADHFSIAVIDGWSAAPERGTVVFRAPAESGIVASVAIRSVAVEGGWVEARTPSMVLQATEKVLRGLPQAQVSGPTEVKREGLVGASFRVSYVPAEGDGQRYDRLHTTWVGKRRIFHVALTAPEGELAQGTKVFDSVVSSIREEG